MNITFEKNKRIKLIKDKVFSEMKSLRPIQAEYHTFRECNLSNFKNDLPNFLPLVFLDFKLHCKL